jgi:hypothetical protein
MLPKILRPDAKGRVTLGHLADGISSYTVTETKDHKLILEPHVEIPARERWLFKSPVALESLKKGIEDARRGRVSSRGSFAKFLDDDQK